MATGHAVDAVSLAGSPRACTRDTAPLPTSGRARVQSQATTEQRKRPRQRSPARSLPGAFPPDFSVTRAILRKLHREVCHVPACPAVPRPINPPACPVLRVTPLSVSKITPRFLPSPSPIQTKRRTPVPFTPARQRPRPGWIHGGKEGRAEAGPARRQAEAEGAQGRLHSPRYRPDRRGHEGPEDDGGGHRGPRRPRRQAAQQALPHGADALRRPGQGGEEGRRRQEGRRQEGGRQEGADPGVHAVVPAAAATVPPAPVLPQPQRRGGPQLLRHLLIGARRRFPHSLVQFVAGRVLCCLPVDHACYGDRRRATYNKAE